MKLTLRPQNTARKAATPVGALWTTAGAAYGHAGGAETSPLRTIQGALGVRTSASTALGNTGPSHRIRG
jgi:hypothetical protein